MTMKWMAVLALALAAGSAFGETAPGAKAGQAKPNGQVKILRQEIKRDQTDLSAKWKSSREQRKELAVQLKAELAKVKVSEGSRAEKTHARRALRDKYARMLKDARAKSVFERRNLREDISSKSAMIKKLRQS
jgi:ribosome-binding protein aMBF1 (putative translation factor)